MTETQVTEALGLRDTCERRRRVLGIPVIVEPVVVVVPVPRTVIPVQVPDVQVAVRVTSKYVLIHL